MLAERAKEYVLATVPGHEISAKIAVTIAPGKTEELELHLPRFRLSDRSPYEWAHFSLRRARGIGEATGPTWMGQQRQDIKSQFEVILKEALAGNPVDKITSVFEASPSGQKKSVSVEVAPSDQKKAVLIWLVQNVNLFTFLKPHSLLDQLPAPKKSSSSSSSASREEKDEADSWLEKTTAALLNGEDGLNEKF